MGLKLIGVSCLEVGVLHPSILKTERPPRHLISAGLIPHHEHLLARSALPRERVRSMTRCRRGVAYGQGRSAASHSPLSTGPSSFEQKSKKALTRGAFRKSRCVRRYMG